MPNQKSIKVCKICNRHLKVLTSHVRTHGIDPEDYYIKYELNGVIPRCPVCGDKCNWSGKLSRGYLLTCKDKSCANKIHSEVAKEVLGDWLRSESGRKEQSRMKSAWYKTEAGIEYLEEYKERLKTGTFSVKALMERSFNGDLDSFKTYRERLRLSYLSKIQGKIWFYVIEMGPFTKIGITKDLEKRIKELKKDVNDILFKTRSYAKYISYIENELLYKYFDNLIVRGDSISELINCESSQVISSAKKLISEITESHSQSRNSTTIL